MDKSLKELQEEYRRIGAEIKRIKEQDNTFGKVRFEEMNYYNKTQLVYKIIVEKGYLRYSCGRNKGSYAIVEGTQINEVINYAREVANDLLGLAEKMEKTYGKET